MTNNPSPKTFEPNNIINEFDSGIISINAMATPNNNTNNTLINNA